MPAADASASSLLPQSGVLVIDKPQGVTSHDVVGAVRSALHMRRVGHAGTLDPMATGVLVIGFGNATRLLNYIVDHAKTYDATIRFGQRTTTDDAEGEIIAVDATDDAACHTLPTLDDVRAAITQSFIGTIEQVPNTYSAIKINGKRAYDMARAGQEVHLQARPVTITRFDVHDAELTTAADGTPVCDMRVTVACSAGTYIRALARDLGNQLGCGAHLTRLRRTAVGQFDVNDPRTLPAYTTTRTFTNRDGQQVTRTKAVLDSTGNALNDYLYSMVDAVEHTLPIVAINEQEARDLRFGRQLHRAIDTTSAAVVLETGDVVAILDRVNSTTSKPTVVFPA